MRSSGGWATVQMPTFVASSPTQKASYVDPALKAQEANTLRDQVNAFIRGGGNYERIGQPMAQPAKRNERQA